MRLGEILALIWNNVDLKNMQIKINSSLKETRVHENHQNELTLKFGKNEFNKDNYVFCSDTETPLNARNAQRAHYQTCTRAEIPHVGFHALRHTFATRMIENGVDVKTVQGVDRTFFNTNDL